MASKWLQWQKARWDPKQRKAHEDYCIDDDGTFYCDHDCASLEEHQRLAVGDRVETASDG